MKQYTAIARELLAEYTTKARKSENLTQDKMAEKLHITSRAYGDLERGKYCFSATALLFLLLTMGSVETKKFLEEFNKRVHELESERIGGRRSDSKPSRYSGRTRNFRCGLRPLPGGRRRSSNTRSTTVTAF